MFLFECLARFQDLYHVRREACHWWWHQFPPARSLQPSDYVSTEEATPENICAIRRLLYKASVKRHREKAPGQRELPYLFGQKRIRYLEKTVANCFHLDFLHHCFPDAQYIFLIRDPRPNISSMMEGWPLIERFGQPHMTTFVRETPGSTVPHWSYAAPPGWRQMLTRPLVQICAWSWRQHIEIALEFFQRAVQPVMVLRYEELTNNPLDVIRQVVEKVDLKLTDRVIEHATARPLSSTTVSQPSQDKWTEHREQIATIEPLIRETAHKIGYDPRK